MSDIHTFLNQDFNPFEYTPFTLIVVDNTKLLEVQFNGQALTITERTLDENPVFFTSSSLLPKLVTPYRQETFEKWYLNGSIPNYHLWQECGKEAWSALVQHEKTHTKGITQAIIYESLAVLRYYPEIWPFDPACYFEKRID